MDINEPAYIHVIHCVIFRRLPGESPGVAGEGWHGSPDEMYEERLLRSKTRGNEYAKGSVTNEPCSQVLYSVGPPVPF